MLAAAAAATASLVLPSGRTVKLAAFDMDGTLLNAQHTLSDASVRALRELSDAGIIVSLCTGRSSPAIEAHVERLASNTLTTNRRDVRACMSVMSADDFAPSCG